MSEPRDPNLPDPNRDWTFALYGGAKHTFNAGESDPQTNKPHYSFQMYPTGYPSDMVQVNKRSIKTAGGNLQAWDVENKSNLPVFITIKRDGELIRVPNCVIKH